MAKKRRSRKMRDWKLYSFLTTEANDVVRPIHKKAMPVILIDPDEQKEWLAGGETSLKLQRPFSDEFLQIFVCSAQTVLSCVRTFFSCARASCHILNDREFNNS